MSGSGMLPASCRVTPSRMRSIEGVVTAFPFSGFQGGPSEGGDHPFDQFLDQIGQAFQVQAIDAGVEEERGDGGKVVFLGAVPEEEPHRYLGDDEKGDLHVRRADGRIVEDLSSQRGGRRDQLLGAGGELTRDQAFHVVDEVGREEDRPGQFLEGDPAVFRVDLLHGREVVVDGRLESRRERDSFFVLDVFLRDGEFRVEEGEGDAVGVRVVHASLVHHGREITEVEGLDPFDGRFQGVKHDLAVAFELSRGTRPDEVADLLPVGGAEVRAEIGFLSPKDQVVHEGEAGGVPAIAAVGSGKDFVDFERGNSHGSSPLQFG